MVQGREKARGGVVLEVTWGTLPSPLRLPVEEFWWRSALDVRKGDAVDVL